MIQNFFNQLSATIQDIQPVIVVVAGDWNARVGDEGAYPGEDRIGSSQCERIALDTSLNTRGRAVIEGLNELGLVILNGRIEGDIPGQYTHLTNTAGSTLDLITVNYNALSISSYLKFIDMGCSDHLLGSAEFHVFTANPTIEQNKLMWSDAKKEHYMEAIVKNIGEEDCTYESFKAMMYKCAAVSGMSRRMRSDVSMKSK